jgi:hypothetical protein
VSTNIFIWTEAIGCGEILPPMVKSFLKHHQLQLNIFGNKKDLEFIKNIDSAFVNPIEVENYGEKFNRKLENSYRKGHDGTALLWQKIISSRSENLMIHLDADNVFLGNCVNEIIEKIAFGEYALCGTRRPYLHRTYRTKGLDGKLLNFRPDVVNTDCFGFNSNYLKTWPAWWFRRKLVGKRLSPLPVIDFFDPISFEIMKRGGKVYFLDSNNGGKRAKPNKKSQVFESRISFAAVGSGLNFYRNPDVMISPGYRSFALASYSTYSKWLLGKDLGIPTLKDEELIGRLKRLDQTNWRLKAGPI